MFISISLSAKDYFGKVGYGGINLGMPIWPFQQLINKDYMGWPVTYIDVDKREDKGDGEIHWTGYYELTNKSNMLIRVYLTEGIHGNVYQICVYETFKSKDAAIKQYQVLKGKMLEKYGSNEASENTMNEFPILTRAINKRQNIELRLDRSKKAYLISVIYGDHSYSGKRVEWYNARENAINTLKYKNDISKY